MGLREGMLDLVKGNQQSPPLRDGASLPVEHHAGADAHENGSEQCEHAATDRDSGFGGRGRQYMQNQDHQTHRKEREAQEPAPLVGEGNPHHASASARVVMSGTTMSG